MKLVLTFGSVLLLALANSNAATIAVGQGFGTNVGIVAKQQFANGGAVLSGGGYYLSVGTFATEPTITDFATLLAAVSSFSSFAELTSPTAAGATQGSIVGSFTSTGGADPAVFNTKSIYMLVGNGATRAASTEWAIINTGVAFPANVTLSGSTPVTLSSINSFTTLANAGTEIDIASGTGKDQLQLVGVPEPSAALLGAIGVLGLLRRRRN